MIECAWCGRRLVPVPVRGTRGYYITVLNGTWLCARSDDAMSRVVDGCALAAQAEDRAVRLGEGDGG